MPDNGDLIMATDLIDFYSKWPKLRQAALALAVRPDLPSTQREVLNWLILLADRVGEQDLSCR